MLQPRATPPAGTVGHTLRGAVWTVVLLTAAVAAAQPAGSIRGLVYDKDFEAPLPLAQVVIAETGEKAAGTQEGNFLFKQVPPGTYTLIVSKPGYTRQVRGNVVVSAGQMTEVEAYLTGDFTEMEEFVAQDLQIGGGSEAALLSLRMESPALMDSIGSDLMSRAGASDAAAALRLVSGATVDGGKYAVVRGLPDRYVNSQMNGVRLPTADVDKRAVQLDQFPAAVIESIQVSKTFTPDQQGDASGGAVNVILKGIPDQTTLSLKLGSAWNTQPKKESDFLSYEGGGVSFWGDETRDPQPNGPWSGAVGVSRDDAPFDYDWSLAGGGKHTFDTGLKIGGFGSFYYKRDSSYFDEGIDDSWWVENPGARMTPRYSQGTPQQGTFNTSLFDVTQASQEVQWGALGVLGAEIGNHSLSLTYMYTRVAEDEVTLAEDTRGKEYFFPGYDRYDFQDPGNIQNQAAMYLRNQTLAYSERTTETLQFSGRHTLEIPELGIDGVFELLPPEIDWTMAQNAATLYEPDKRQFGTKWLPPLYFPARPPFRPQPVILPARHLPLKPDATFRMGNLQRTWKEIVEDSDQWFMNVKFPFEQWSGDEGYVKLGVFNDEVRRSYDQDSFSNFGATGEFLGEWEEFWSDYWDPTINPISDGPPYLDADYKGEQNISAWYYMMDLPLCSFLNLIGGARYETTELATTVIYEDDATWYDDEQNDFVSFDNDPDAANVKFNQDDILPSIGFQLKPIKDLKFRGSYSETVARQTFKELTPIQQAEYLGGPVFIGNPDLKMSAVKNYDLRLDYAPYQGGLVSVSYFYKEVTDAIEYVQRVAGNYVFTLPVNYPEGTLKGWEFEVRQDVGHFWDVLKGLTLGANATLIESQVTLPADEATQFTQPNIQAPMPTRDMTNAPEFLYNLFATYDIEQTGTQFAVFYTVRGDTLVAGAGQSKGNFIPNVYELEYGTLNVSVTQKLGKYIKVKFAAKNLADPDIETVYRSGYIGADVLKTSYRKGIEYSIGISAEFTF